MYDLVWILTMFSPCFHAHLFSKNWQSRLKVLVLSSFFALSACQDSPNPTEKPETQQKPASTPASQPKPQSTSVIIASTVNDTASVTASAASATAPAVANLLTIYTSIDRKNLVPFFENFSKKTGVMVNVVQDEPMSILAKLQAEGDNSPADIILTEDVGVFHHGVEHNLLQPFNAEKAVSQVPARFIDPDAHWLALTYYGRLAVYDSRVVEPNNISSYADLAKPKWYQKLCLSQRSYAPNQSFVVDLVHQLGDKKAEDVLKGYIQNLAMPVVLNDDAIFQAIDSGKCQIGLVNSQNFVKYQQNHKKTNVQPTWINIGYGGVHTNALAVGIPRTAHQPELALQLIDWLADKEQIGLFASISHTFPLNAQVETSALLKSWGEFKPSQINVSEYGEKQKSAVEMMETVGYR